jgi:hypothetical protein
LRAIHHPGLRPDRLRLTVLTLGSRAVAATQLSEGTSWPLAPRGAPSIGRLLLGGWHVPSFLRGDTERRATPGETKQHIDALNRDFGNLRELLQNSEPSLVEALLDPVLDRFAETLASVAEDYPDLAPKCETLTHALHTFTDPSPPQPSWDAQDDDLPF